MTELKIGNITFTAVTKKINPGELLMGNEHPIEGYAEYAGNKMIKEVEQMCKPKKGKKN